MYKLHRKKKVTLTWWMD